MRGPAPSANGRKRFRHDTNPASFLGAYVTREARTSALRRVRSPSSVQQNRPGMRTPMTVGDGGGPVPVPDALRGEMGRLRPAAMTDAARLTEILVHPDVEAWWGPHDLTAVQAKVSGQDDGSVPFAIEADGEIIGLIQYG